LTIYKSYSHETGTAALPPFSVLENGGMSEGQGGCQAGIASIVENVKALEPEKKNLALQKVWGIIVSPLNYSPLQPV
jgi:hypothetical protein